MVQQGKELFPLSWAQKMHFYTLKYCPKKEILNIGTSLTVGNDLIDFDMLEKAIMLAYERCESMRLRFTEDENGEYLQYIVPKEERKLERFDFTGWKYEDAEDEMRRWTCIPFSHDNAPMNRIVLVTMPDGYKGMYMNVDHMTMDSYSIIIFMKDIVELYCNMKYDFPFPKPMTSYIETLKKDLEYEDNSPEMQRDEAFWQEFLARPEPIFTDVNGDKALQEQREALGNPDLRAARVVTGNVEASHEMFHLEAEPSQRLLEFCLSHRISMVCLLLLGLRTFLSKMNHNEPDISINSTISRRGNLLKKKSGGTRIHFFPCRTIVPPETTFEEALHVIQRSQFEIFRHADFDPIRFKRMVSEYRHLQPGQAYECMSLTYQPMTMKADDDLPDELDYKSNWYSNGVAANPLYLTVMHNAVDKGLDFYFEYQTGRVTFKELEYLYYYMCRILFKGIENPAMTIGEILDTV